MAAYIDITRLRGRDRALALLARNRARRRIADAQAAQSDASSVQPVQCRSAKPESKHGSHSADRRASIVCHHDSDWKLVLPKQTRARRGTAEPNAEQSDARSVEPVGRSSAESQSKRGGHSAVCQAGIGCHHGRDRELALQTRNRACRRVEELKVANGGAFAARLVGRKRLQFERQCSHKTVDCQIDNTRLRGRGGGLALLAPHRAHRRMADAAVAQIGAFTAKRLGRKCPETGSQRGGRSAGCGVDTTPSCGHVRCRASLACSRGRHCTAGLEGAQQSLNPARHDLHGHTKPSDLDECKGEGRQSGFAPAHRHGPWLAPVTGTRDDRFRVFEAARDKTQGARHDGFEHYQAGEPGTSHVSKDRLRNATRPQGRARRLALPARNRACRRIADAEAPQRDAPTACTVAPKGPPTGKRRGRLHAEGEIAIAPSCGRDRGQPSLVRGRSRRFDAQAEAARQKPYPARPDVRVQPDHAGMSESRGPGRQSGVAAPRRRGRWLALLAGTLDECCRVTQAAPGETHVARRARPEHSIRKGQEKSWGQDLHRGGAFPQRRSPRRARPGGSHVGRRLVFKRAQHNSHDTRHDEDKHCKFRGKSGSRLGDERLLNAAPQRSRARWLALLDGCSGCRPAVVSEAARSVSLAARPDACGLSEAEGQGGGGGVASLDIGRRDAQVVAEVGRHADHPHAAARPAGTLRNEEAATELAPCVSPPRVSADVQGGAPAASDTPRDVAEPFLGMTDTGTEVLVPSRPWFWPESPPSVWQRWLARLRRLEVKSADPPGDGWRWSDFSPAEMACRHCGEGYHWPAFMDALQAARDRVGRPFRVLSAHRCSLHNARVGGAPRSQHLRLAVDIGLRGHDRHALHRALRDAGFTGFGFYTTFIHADMGPARHWFGNSKARSLWQA